jgi:hypothetical protein
MGTSRIVVKMNRELAQFMGGEVERIEEHVMPHGSNAEVCVTIWKIPHGVPNSTQHDFARIGQFKYDTDWAWLWPVIDKIESLGFDVSICRNSIQIHRRLAVDHQYDQSNLIVEESEIYDDFVGEDKLFATFTVCARFVEWYNNQKKETNNETVH